MLRTPRRLRNHLNVLRNMRQLRQLNANALHLTILPLDFGLLGINEIPRRSTTRLNHKLNNVSPTPRTITRRRQRLTYIISVHVNRRRTIGFAQYREGKLIFMSVLPLLRTTISRMTLPDYFRRNTTTHSLIINSRGYRLRECASRFNFTPLM